MDRNRTLGLPFDRIPTPCYVVDTELLGKNLLVLDDVQKRTGVKIILALKGFAMFSVFPQIRKHLHGTTASSLNEARLGREEFGKEVHVYAPAYKEDEFADLLRISNHITFNSFNHWKRHRERALAGDHSVRFGIRINPEYSEVEVELYNPCRPGSRFGMTIGQFKGEDLTGISGLHFHTMCEQNSDTLKRTLDVVEKKFGRILENMDWINMGGGHHISRADYDVDLLCDTLNAFKRRFDLDIYLEPGEAIALNTGYLVASVLDLFQSDGQIAILDTSATAHMPDVLEMPYRPQIVGGGEADEFAHTYTLGGLTCLSGDVIGDYSFKEPLGIGDKLVFMDMAHYTMVKNTTFNGIPLPSIATYNPTSDDVKVVRKFGYEDYKGRLS
ncbi:MAG: carboxynorspermidine decarboxylase [Verrucomicrobia bacterium]|nr:carboxynorspermidine decarboxylase [Verrucomicrobiota bacterium]